MGAPALIYVLAVAGWPLAQGIWYSVFDYSLLHPATRQRKPDCRLSHTVLQRDLRKCRTADTEDHQSQDRPGDHVQPRLAHAGSQAATATPATPANTSQETQSRAA